MRRFYLLHIRGAIRTIQSYAPDRREEFLQDKKTQDAVIRNLEIIGEAGRISERSRESAVLVVHGAASLACGIA